MSEEKKLTGIGIRRKGEKGFKVRGNESEPIPRTGPRVIHNGAVSKCSECGFPVNIPAGTCGTCPHCTVQFGGCG